MAALKNLIKIKGGSSVVFILCNTIMVIIKFPEDVKVFKKILTSFLGVNTDLEKWKS